MNLSKEQIAELKDFICKTYILDGQDVEKDLTEKFGAKECEKEDFSKEAETLVNMMYDIARETYERHDRAKEFLNKAKEKNSKNGAKEGSKEKKVVGIYYRELTDEERKQNKFFTGLILELENGVLLQGNATDTSVPFSEWKDPKQTEQRG